MISVSSDGDDNISMDDKNHDEEAGDDQDICNTSNNTDQNSDEDVDYETYTDENEEKSPVKQQTSK